MMTGIIRNRRLIDMNEIADNIYNNQNFHIKTNSTKDNLMKVFLSFHVFTACDTISVFAGCGKLKLLNLL